MNKKDKAIRYFNDHFNCSQAVLTVFGPEYGLSEDQCLKAACGFGAGIGRQQFTCGALTGAVIALGLKYGKASGDPEEKKTETYYKTRELFEEFKKLHGSTICRELLKGLDINDQAGHKRIMELGLFETLCVEYVSDSVAITEKLIK
jgi:C_GCAxxG_C_C family probable redox protein